MHYYILLYKIKECETSWIINKKLKYCDIINKANNCDKYNKLYEYTSKTDQYLIIKQKNCTNNDIRKIDKLKRFTKFKYDKNSIVLFKTRLI